MWEATGKVHALWQRPPACAWHGQGRGERVKHVANEGLYSISEVPLSLLGVSFAKCSTYLLCPSLAHTSMATTHLYCPCCPCPCSLRPWSSASCALLQPGGPSMCKWCTECHTGCVVLQAFCVQPPLKFQRHRHVTEWSLPNVVRHL